ncbi:MAG: two-component sensor histidine kinase [Bacteroidetes bacterium]|nr:MAG: two-component sensor histidine kinase [Bacteroidota bacterium]
MDFYGRKNLWKFLLFLFAVAIGALTLFYTEGFLQQLRQEEIKKVDQWANAMASIQRADESSELTLATQIIQYNSTIPLIVTDVNGNITHTNNLEVPKRNKKERLQELLQQMKEKGQFIEVLEAPGKINSIVYYESSTLLTKLRFYPIILLVVISLFIIIAYLAFSGARKAEQNQVWNGLAKETAHQIGTPLSSLMGWLELLKMQNVDASITVEMGKDIKRLETITDRFSKIGSQPALIRTDLLLVTRQAVDYLKNRSSKKIEITCQLPRDPIFLELNVPLFEWVIENLIRNAIDAISGPGKIKIELQEKEAKWVQIEVSDTGKGISAKSLQTVFRPGYSTKKRGWGLGLSLAKRIIEDYHKGRIFVAQSVPNEGTTFRILLPKLE